jgi:aminoglycoside 6'-N-acetyltransferase
MDQQSCFSFKPLTQEDFQILLPWFKEEHVGRWWPTPAAKELLKHFLKRIRSEDTFAFVVYLNDEPIGYIQYYYIDCTGEKVGKWLPELPKHTLGIDQFIGRPEYIGKGYGTQFIKQFIKYLSTELEPQVTAIIVDPDPTNQAAIRCYEKVGFKDKGIYNTPTGSMLLMEYHLKK